MYNFKDLECNLKKKKKKKQTYIISSQLLVQYLVKHFLCVI